MPVMPHRRLDERAAHESVTAEAASNMTIEWPVSGDETLRRFGYAGQETHVNLWRNPRVIPNIPTAGIVVGSRIETYWTSGVVSRVGTIAGSLIEDETGAEVSWNIQHVTFVEPMPDARETQ